MYKCANTIIYWLLIQPFLCIFVLASEIPNSVIAADFDDPVRAGEIRAMCFVDAKRVWAVRITNTGGLEVLRSKDGAKTWQTCDPGGDWLEASQNAVAHTKETKRCDALMLDLFAQDSNVAWVAIAAKHDGKAAAFVVETRDGGVHWSGHLTEIGSDVEVLNLQFVDSKNGFMIGRSRPATNEFIKHIYRTKDGGITWSEMILPKDSAPDSAWEGCVFRTQTDGWLVTEEVIGQEPIIFWTHNGGKDWKAEVLNEPENLRNSRRGGRGPNFLAQRKSMGLWGCITLRRRIPKRM